MDHNISVGEAAKSLGISVGELYAYEHGERLPSAVTLRRMALLYGISADTLLAEASGRPGLVT